MSRKGGSLSVNSNINQNSSYYYYGLLFLGIILLLLLFKFVGETLYYRGPRAKQTPTPSPSGTPTPSRTPSGTPSGILPGTLPGTLPSIQSMIKPNVLPVETLTPNQTNKNPLNIDSQVLAVVKGRLIDLGDNYNKLTNDDKKAVGGCYANPNGCTF